MKNYVENNLLGKLFRTLGYVALLVSSSLISMSLVFAENAEFFMIDTLRDLLQPVQDIILSVDLLQDTFYYVALFFIGLLFLVWTLSKSLLGKILQTVLFVAVFALIFYSQDAVLLPVTFTTPDWLANVLDMVSSFLDQAIDFSEFALPLVALLATLLIWRIFAMKKPKRIATFLGRLGSITLFLAVLLLFAATAFEAFVDPLIFEDIRVYLYFATFDLFAVASVFGILGFLRS